MKSNNKVIFLTVLISTMLYAGIYYVALIDYNHQLEKFYMNYSSVTADFNERIQEAFTINNSYLNLLNHNEINDDSILNGLLSLTNKSYLSSFNITHDELFKAKVFIPKSPSQISWTSYLYAHGTMRVLSDNELYNIPKESIVIGQRYGNEDTITSGIVGIHLDLNNLVQDMIEDGDLAEGQLFITSESGNILYHNDYINVMKPSMTELFINSKLISDTKEMGIIQKAIYRGKYNVMISKTFPDTNVLLVYSLPWGSIFQGWQMRLIFLIFLGAVLTAFIYLAVKNHTYVQLFKQHMNINDRGLKDRDFKKLSDIINYQKNMKQYFRYGLSNSLELLKLVIQKNHEIPDEKFIMYENYIIQHMNQKLDIQINQSNIESIPGKDAIESFKTHELIYMMIDFMLLKSKCIEGEVIPYLDDTVDQEVYGYPEVICQTVIYIFDQLMTYQNKLYVAFKIRGEMTVTFRTVEYIQYDESKISDIGQFLKSKYNIDIQFSTRTLKIAWPILKKGHFPINKSMVKDYIHLTSYGLDSLTERVIHILSEKMHIDYRVLDNLSDLNGILMITIETIEKCPDNAINIIKQYPYVILLHQEDEMPYVWADKIEAIAFLNLPLKETELKNILSLVQYKFTDQEKNCI